MATTGSPSMTLTRNSSPPVHSPDRFYIGGDWVTPSSGETFDVIDSATEELYFSVALALAPDMDWAVASARKAFDVGPWPQMTHAERAGYLRRFADEVRHRVAALSDIWPRESGVLASLAWAISGGA